MTIVEPVRTVTGGVDTHLDVHVAAVLDPLGGLLGSEPFETTPAGYKALLIWLEGFGEVGKVGVEGTGSYGAGLARFLRRRRVEVVEVDRPNRQVRRRQGKSDPLDAIEAARAALSGRAQGQAKSRDGAVEAVRVLVVAKRSARQARVKALTQVRHLGNTAPDQLRCRMKGLSVTHRPIRDARARAEEIDQTSLESLPCGGMFIPGTATLRELVWQGRELCASGRKGQWRERGQREWA
jgi:transposase